MITGMEETVAVLRFLLSQNDDNARERLPGSTHSGISVLSLSLRLLIYCTSMALLPKILRIY